MSKLLFFSLLLLFLALSASSAMMGSMVGGPKCSEFCPSFCKGKCNGVEAQSSCDGEHCKCACPASGVDCKEDECNTFCEKHSGGRVSKSSCIKPHVCKCSFGDPSKENMNPMPYSQTSDLRTEVQIIPEK